MKNDSRITIDQLHLKVPGLSQHQGRVLGQQIATGLAKQWPRSGRSIELGAVDIRLQSSAVNGNTQQLADQVVNAIIRRTVY